MRVRRSFWNFGTTVLLTAVTTAVGLVATPWLKRWLGDRAFGAARVLNDASGYLTLLELGLSGALGPLTARAVASAATDPKPLRDAVTAGVRAYLRVSVLAVGVGLLLTPAVGRLVPASGPAEAADFRTAWLVGLLAFGPMACLPLRSVVEAEQRGYAVNLGLLAQSLLTTGTALALARAGWGVTGQSLALVLGVWAFNLGTAAAVCRRHRGLWAHLRAAPTDPQARAALRSLSPPALVINVCGRLSLLTDNLVIAPALGVGRVTSLFFTQRPAVLGQTVLQGVGNATWAALADLHARGDSATFNRRLVELTRLTALLAAAGLAPAVAFNAAFFRLWAPAGVRYEGDVVAAVAAVNVGLVAVQSLWAWSFTAAGRARRLVAPTAASAALNLAASLALVRPCGVLGPLLGTTLGLAGVGLWWLPLRLRATFGTSPAALARATAPAAAWGALAAAGLHAWAQRHPPTTWAALAAEAALAALACLAAGAALALPPEERALWRARLRRPAGG